MTYARGLENIPPISGFIAWQREYPAVPRRPSRPSNIEREIPRNGRLQASKIPQERKNLAFSTDGG
jgi:hypothetical protein